ncbi:hypothetical protein RhiirB3_394226 [Rhizophagus irregularis]|nr:hypothetical protein RhiirB3_394226 [Rhizophagus irregularis]
MTFLFAKLVGITLPIREFGSHLNSQKNVVDEELVQKNFKYGDLSSKTRALAKFIMLAQINKNGFIRYKKISVGIFGIISFKKFGTSCIIFKENFKGLQLLG